LDLQEHYSAQAHPRTIAIPEGNYSSQQYLNMLITALNSGYVSYAMTYSNIQNVYSIKVLTSNATSTLLFATGANKSKSNYKFLGFNCEDVFVGSSPVFSQNCVVMSDIYYLQLKTDLGDGLLSPDGSDSILEVIELPTQPYTFIHHKPINLNKFILNSKVLDQIRITLIDNHNRIVDLNSVPFSAILKIEIIDNKTHNIPYSTGRVNEDSQQPENPTNLELISRQPDIISMPKPLPVNDLVDWFNIQKMLQELDLQKMKKKLTKKQNQNKETQPNN
jgi:hypothetical protein